MTILNNRTIALATVMGLTLGLACSDDDNPPPKPDVGIKVDQKVPDTGTPDTKKPTPDMPVADMSQSDADGMVGDDAMTDGMVADALPCQSCHELPPNTGKHFIHREKGFKCSDCHGDVVNAVGAIINATLHNNGTKNYSGSATRTNNSCTGGCHGGHVGVWN